MDEQFEFLMSDFLDAMNDIGRYGQEKYADQSFHARRLSNNRVRDVRTTSIVIAEHARKHFEMHLRKEPHDKFLTHKHQLAAVAFNAMMEYYFARLDEEGSCK